MLNFLKVGKSFEIIVTNNRIIVKPSGGIGANSRSISLIAFWQLSKNMRYI
jgi:hypothetical protein